MFQCNSDQAKATYGPRDTSGPQSLLMCPVSYIWSILDSYFDVENM